jgi:hypothetical protein
MVVADPEGPAYVFEKSRADMPRPSNSEATSGQGWHICRPP